MKVLTVSNDPSIFIAMSPARARMRAYAAAMPDGELHILSRAPKAAREEQDGNLFLHPARTPRWLILFVLPVRVRQLVKKYAIDIVSAQDPFEYGFIARKGIRG